MIKRKEFVESLKTVLPAVSKGGVIPQGNCFAFVPGAVIAFNGDIAIKQPMDYIDFTSAVSASEMIQVLNRLPSDEVDCKLSDEGLCIKTEKTITSFKADMEIKLPVGDILDSSLEWLPVCDSFVTSLHLCMGMCSKDSAREILRYIHVEEDNMRASDGARAIKHKLNAKYAEMFINTVSAKNICTFVPTQYALSTGWLYFRKESGAVLACRTIIDEQYPCNALDGFFDSEGSKIIDLKHEMIEMLSTTAIMSEKNNAGFRFVNIKTNKGTMVISSVGSGGSHKERIKIESQESIDTDLSVDCFKDMILLGTEMHVVDKRTCVVEAPGLYYATCQAQKK